LARDAKIASIVCPRYRRQLPQSIVECPGPLRLEVDGGNVAWLRISGRESHWHEQPGDKERRGLLLDRDEDEDRENCCTISHLSLVFQLVRLCRASNSPINGNGNVKGVRFSLCHVQRLWLVTMGNWRTTEAPPTSTKFELFLLNRVSHGRACNLGGISWLSQQSFIVEKVLDKLSSLSLNFICTFTPALLELSANHGSIQPRGGLVTTH